MRQLKNMIGVSSFPAACPEPAKSNALAFEKEITLLWEKQAEARQVDLLLAVDRPGQSRSVVRSAVGSVNQASASARLRRQGRW